MRIKCIVQLVLLSILIIGIASCVPILCKSKDIVDDAISNAKSTNNMTWTQAAELFKDGTVINPEVTNLKSQYGKILDIKLNEEQKFKVIGYSTIPAKNCVGKNTIRLNETLSKSITTEYTIDGNVQVEADLLTMISAGIGVQFGLTRGTTMQRSFFFEVDVMPNTNNEYKIVWKEIWQSGRIEVSKKNGEKEIIPFEIKSGIQYELNSVKELKCN